MRYIDIAIIGGGLAGSMAATMLRRAGMDAKIPPNRGRRIAAELKTGDIKIRPTDLHFRSGHRQPGVVPVSDNLKPPISLPEPTTC
jgi:folate-dependent tRNA-U54 methylase TrmFO/GidA